MVITVLNKQESTQNFMKTNSNEIRVKLRQLYKQLIWAIEIESSLLHDENIMVVEANFPVKFLAVN